MREWAMGVLVLVDEGPGTFPVVSEWFRLSDENPVTLDLFAENGFGDLPPYVEDVIVAELGLRPTEWNALVDRGAVFEVVDPQRWFSLERFCAQVRARSAAGAPPDACDDCWGTWASCDVDGSMTGHQDAVYVCHCALGLMSRAGGRPCPEVVDVADLGDPRAWL